MTSLFQFWLRRERWSLNNLWKLFRSVFDLVVLPYFIVLVGGMVVVKYWDLFVLDRGWLMPHHGMMILFIAFAFVMIGRYLVPFHYSDEAILFTMPIRYKSMIVYSVVKQLTQHFLYLCIYILIAFPVLKHLYQFQVIEAVWFTILLFLLKVTVMNIDWIIYQWKKWPRRMGLLIKWFVFIALLFAFIHNLTTDSALLAESVQSIPICITVVLMMGVTTFMASRKKIVDWSRIVDDAMRRRLAIYHVIYGTSHTKKANASKKTWTFMRTRFRIPFTQKGAMLEQTIKGFFRKREVWGGYVQLSLIFTGICWQVPIVWVKLLIISFAIIVLSELLLFMAKEREQIWLKIVPFEWDAKKGIKQGVITLLSLPILLMTAVSFYYSILLILAAITFAFFVLYVTLSIKLKV